MLEGVSNGIEVFLLVATAAALVLGWVKKVRPKVKERERDRIAQRDVLLGRPPVYDSIIPGKEIAPALPGIGKRMETVEQALVTITQNQHDLDDLRQRVDGHDGEIAELRAAAMERVASKIESIAAYDAMQRALDAQPDHIDVESDES